MSSSSPSTKRRRPLSAMVSIPMVLVAAIVTQPACTSGFLNVPPSPSHHRSLVRQPGELSPSRLAYTTNGEYASSSSPLSSPSTSSDGGGASAASHHTSRRQEPQAEAATASKTRKPNLKMKVDAKSILHSRSHQGDDPSNVVFADSEEFNQELIDQCELDGMDCSAHLGASPFAAMLQGSARYIADHLGETVVIHVPGDLIERDDFPSLLDDIAMTWLLGMKIVLVVGCRSTEDGCSSSFDHAHECHNSLRTCNDQELRLIEEEAGFVRFEVERRLNKSLRRQSGVSKGTKDQPACHGNVLGGNFYTTHPFGTVRGIDYEHTGYTSKVHVENIKNALNNNDVVLLTTIAPSRNGELVTVNGNHLAAVVAKALEAHKVIYMSKMGKVLKRKGETKSFQDVPLSMAKAVLDYHRVGVHKSGFAAFEHARQTLEPGAVELLLHLGWAVWAVDEGVTRAHIVNPGDGALLEECFTAKHGANTCLFHDDELEGDDEDVMVDSDLHSFLEAAAAQGANIQ